jgi:diguanylate cyclase (GGDEF)-like protein
MLNDLTLAETTTLLDRCPLALLLTDDAGNVRGFNQAFTRLVGDTAMLDVSHEDLGSTGLLNPLLGPDTLISWIMPDGDERWLAMETTVLNAITARFYQDVTEKLRLRKERDNCSEKLKDHSLRDDLLTSLLNRRGILVSLEPLVARSRRYNSPLAVIALGLQTDQVQDKALVKVSYLLKDQTRWADLVGCNEQHDFLLILQETTRDSALLLVDKLAEHLKRTSEGQPAPLTVFYGVTHYRKNDDAESLLERAESALMEARNNPSGKAIVG